MRALTLAIAAAALALAVGAAAAAPGDGPSASGGSSAPLGPLCASLADEMGLDPALVGSFVGSLPEPPAEDFCTWLNDNQTQTQACDFLALMSFGLTEGGNFQPPTCYLNGTSQAVPLPPGGLTALRDARPLPPAFPDPAATFQEEGASFHWLFHMHAIVLLFSSCAGNPNASLALPPGWALAGTGNMSQPEGPPLPLLFVLRNEETNQLLLMVRSTRSNYEWSLNFQFNQTTSNETRPYFGDAGIEVGFFSIFREIWPAAKAALEDAMLAAARAAGPRGLTQSVLPEIWVAGHSQGSAVGKLVAYAAQDFLNTGREIAPVINGVFFASPQVGSAEFAARYDQLVNSRDVDFSGDLISQTPCQPTMPACPANTSGLLNTVGVKGIATDQGGVSAWPYVSTGGLLRFTAQDMPQDAATWAELRSMPLCWASTYLTAAHSCSYFCYTSQFVSEAVDFNSCWLSAKPGGQAGSQCWGFPNDWIGGGAPPAPGGAPAPAAPNSPGTAPAPEPALPPTEAPRPSPAASSAAASSTTGRAMCARLVAVLAVLAAALSG